MTARSLATCGLTAVLACAPAVSGAGQLQAGPTMLEIAPENSAARLVLGNSGSAPIAVQVRIYEWSQVEGDDYLLPSDALVVSPPIAELAPAAEQVVRVVRIGPPASGRDRTYRLVVDELPGDSGVRENAVKIRLRYVLPVFVRASGVPGPLLACTIDQGAARLTCTNGGGQAAQLGASRLVDETGRAVPLSDGLFGYVLPGSRRTWRLPADPTMPPGSHLRLESRLNGQITSLPVAAAP